LRITFNIPDITRDVLILILIYLLTAIGLTHLHTKIYRTTQLTTLVGKLSGIRTQNGQTKINVETKIKVTYRILVGKPEGCDHMNE